ncbi:murein tripeptide/oligopeptide ABC transporter ATP binding protein OppF [Aestuariispira insulae]|uniref:Oligopeptide transport system ATP-binding protein n=1 Tax=Aestuariispira insulae TaxID=1461337 RepID=A0A3D9HWT7_9PROT|nr:murein tripeptide/oligopeptide ABC transporter ATP binding protein OppF [Aestuariispira insulae]RED53968.1 oligopeptide transport system ATP-binding protein [Aestuariispira insulae]
MSDTILNVEDLKVHFQVPRGGFFGGRVPLKAVDGVSFELKSGETLGIVGESGCGKSTLGRAVLQLIEPTGGNVAWLGSNITGLDAKTMRPYRKDMQIIFQDPLASLNPRMTIGEIIGEPLKTHYPEISRKDRREKVRQMMDKVGLLPQMINRYPHEFSGGQCQRIGIARAMILEPKVIVCDEPVSALDVSIQAQVVNLLQDLQKEFGLSLLFISHDLSVVRHISHRIMVLYLGKVMEIAPKDAIYADPRHPYTKALISAVPIPDPDRERNKEIVVLQGDLPSPIAPPSGCVFRTRCPFADDECAKTAPQPESVEAGHTVSCLHWQKLGG